MDVNIRIYILRTLDCVKVIYVQFERRTSLLEKNGRGKRFEGCITINSYDDAFPVRRSPSAPTERNGTFFSKRINEELFTDRAARISRVSWCENPPGGDGIATSPLAARYRGFLRRDWIVASREKLGCVWFDASGLNAVKREAISRARCVRHVIASAVRVDRGG